MDYVNRRVFLLFIVKRMLKITQSLSRGYYNLNNWSDNIVLILPQRLETKSRTDLKRVGQIFSSNFKIRKLFFSRLFDILT